MIEFKYIDIENFMSIKKERVVFENGIYSLSGKNMAGKTTTILALLQGLYNKNIKSGSDKIEETYNKITKLPYKIEINFFKNNKEYLVINDRVNNSISILEDDIDISPKSIKAQLKKIEDIIGFSYTIFSSFYYLSTTTLLDIFNVSSDNNLVYKFFDIETIKLLEKELKTRQKELKLDIQMVSANLKSIDKQINMLTNFKQIDKEGLLNKKSILQEALLTLLDSNESKKVKLLHNEISKLDNQLNSLKVEYKAHQAKLSILEKQKATFDRGICPVCGSNVENMTTSLTQELEDLHKLKDNILAQKVQIDTKKDNILSILVESETNLKIKQTELNNEIQSIDAQLLVYEEEERRYKQLADNLIHLEKEKLIFKEKYSDIQDELAYISVALAVIKSNAITKEYLNNFIVLLNSKIKELSEYVNFTTDIIISETRGKLKFKFVEGNIEKTLNALSAGEKTRVALITLFSVLETLSILANNKFNLLVLDELLGVLDEEGVETLKLLLQKYKDNMCIFVVLHHNEIDSNFFDGVYNVHKTNGITNIEYKGN